MPNSPRSQVQALIGLNREPRERTHWRERAAAGAVLALILANVFVLIVNLRAPPPFDPLGDYPVQRISLPLAGPEDSEIPTLHLRTGDEPLPVHAVKCNNQDTDVPVTGVTQWRLVDKPGTFVDANRGQAVRKPGCEQFNYRNPVPQGVKDSLRQLHEQGFDVSVWQIVGQETPVSPDGKAGAVKLFQSDNFQIVYEMG